MMVLVGTQAELLRVVERGYDRLGDRYWRWAETVDPPLRSDFAAAATTGLGCESVAVELGCGPGHPVGHELSGRLSYVGVDISLAMLRLARANAPDASLVRADMASVAFRPAAVDAVVAFYSLIHVPRELHPTMLRSIAGWLRPGGRFAASLGAEDNPSKVHPGWLGAVEMYWSFFDAETNLRLIADAGLKIERAVEVEQREEGKPIRFLWVLAQRPQ